MKITGIPFRRWAALFFTLLLMLSMAPAALADTDENTPRITRQPDQLVLQLGARWAGVEFELRTDAGKFPVPVVVDESGVLTMDLGGSSTYTLSCLESLEPVPAPEPKVEPAAELAPPSETPEDSSGSASHLMVLFLLLLLAVIVIAMLVYMRHQRKGVYGSWENDEDAL